MEYIVTLLAGAGLVSALIGAFGAYKMVLSKHSAEKTYIDILMKHQSELIEIRARVIADGVLSKTEVEYISRMLEVHAKELEPKHRSLIVSPLRQESLVGRKAYTRKIFARAGVPIEVAT